MTELKSLSSIKSKQSISHKHFTAHIEYNFSFCLFQLAIYFKGRLDNALSI